MVAGVNPVIVCSKPGRLWLPTDIPGFARSRRNLRDTSGCQNHESPPLKAVRVQITHLHHLVRYTYFSARFLSLYLELESPTH